MDQNEHLDIASRWFEQQGWQPFPFQREAWRHYLDGYSGLVNAPTGTGKTYSLAMGILLEGKSPLPASSKGESLPPTPSEGGGERGLGLQAIWITPIRALAKEIQGSIQRAADGLGLDWRVAIRSGDTKSGERAKQKKNPPEVLITTPESLHLLLASKGYSQYFKGLKTIVVDEWHELIGSKRGVQVELALSRLKGLLPGLKVWGISATIGNMDEALAVLLGNTLQTGHYKVVRANISKRIEVESILPDEIERFPWAGHLGIRLLEKVLPVLEQSQSTLIFTNTRAQCEIWYQNLLEIAPDLAGAIAMHHSSISRELRDWVEDALHQGILKAVVCTSSLDLGVDFRPVESIIQIGSPKGVARFMQRAGRSGHQPGALSKIYFVPAHSLELIEAAALRRAIGEGEMESRIPYIRSFDVLLQYLVTLAVSEGFRPEEIYQEVKGTYSFGSMTEEEWAWCLDFITTGGPSLEAYEEYKKVVVEDGLYKVVSRRTAMRHRLQIGAIVSDVNMTVKYVGGKRIGTIEEWFIAQLRAGDVFWFAGRSLELVRIKDMTVQVKRSQKKTGKIPSWQGGRMPLSSQLSSSLRFKMAQLSRRDFADVELEKLAPLIELQARRSHVPHEGAFLIEYFKSREGYHLLLYPFEGRSVHEGMGALIAYRISRLQPLSFSIAMNDYGFELLSDSEIPVEEALKQGLFSTEGLSQDIQASINAAELAKRRFRDIASISGLVFKGFPGKQKKDRHLQSSSQLFFEVFNDYEPNNLLLLQAYDEVMSFQLEEARLRAALRRIQSQRIVLSRPEQATPFAFPIMVDRLRGRLSSEKLEDRIRKMKLQLIRE
ncbi:MAG: ligase-associated DNA damage response DEXH box helicase [Lewinellaceae bacterium]|nr:ligase-associated DNA damage response DEXH box helicase [Phaeodactylibacter sp.]MCB0612866.1 ligase-associated DNA damage response DEXH box helicase [Phaeodactylibacter sp.]MCB9346759.1 ligase-associated DNA damage response DEXH box helicase [Lewinellaceae bacterium]